MSCPFTMAAKIEELERRIEELKKRERTAEMELARIRSQIADAETSKRILVSDFIEAHKSPQEKERERREFYLSLNETDYDENGVRHYH